jgi:hypothetical protein
MSDDRSPLEIVAAPADDFDAHIDALHREIAVSQQAHLCRSALGGECRCKAFATWVVAEAQRLLADPRVEVRRQGERLLRSVINGFGGRPLASDNDNG